MTRTAEIVKSTGRNVHRVVPITAAGSERTIRLVSIVIRISHTVLISIRRITAIAVAISSVVRGAVVVISI